MATVTGMTAAAMEAIRDSTVVGAEFDAGGHLILTKYDGTQIDAGVISDATTGAKGLVELATNAEVATGTDTGLVVTPAALASRSATETLTGLVELATTTEAQTGTDTSRAVTPAGLSTALTSALSTSYRYVTTVLYTNNGSFAKGDYPSMKAIRVRLVGGGGGGGGSHAASSGQHSSGGGGGGGGYAEKFILVGDLGTSETVGIGSGGTGVSGSTGNTGGETTFGSLVSAWGGDPGLASSASATFVVGSGGWGGTLGIGDFGVDGFTGGIGTGYAGVGAGGSGGGSYFGGSFRADWGGGAGGEVDGE